MITRPDLAAIRMVLDDIDRISNEEWLGSLDVRKRKELEFHDKDRDRINAASMDGDTYERFYGNKKYYHATELSKDYVRDWIIKNATGKVFLDYACGNGVYAIVAARAGAGLSIGIDISRTSVLNARADAKEACVDENCRFVQGDAENTRLPDNSVDTVICSGMLHHLDLSYAFPELRRILAPGGKILAVEALDYNPAIKLYRWRTPEMRTEWEAAHILSLKDVEFAKRFFDVRDVHHWHITSIAAPHLPFVPHAVFNAVDSVLTRLPLIKLMSWMFTFVLVKRD